MNRPAPTTENTSHAQGAMKFNGGFSTAETVQLKRFLHTRESLLGAKINCAAGHDFSTVSIDRALKYEGQFQLLAIGTLQINLVAFQPILNDASGVPFQLASIDFAKSNKESTFCRISSR